MPRLTILLGSVLIALGVLAYIMTDAESWTALIPSILGLIILISGIIGVKRPKIGIHIALLVALLGLFGTGMNIIPPDDLFAGRLAAVFSAITFVLLLGYIIAGVRSFIQARRWKNQGVIG